MILHRRFYKISFPKFRRLVDGKILIELKWDNFYFIYSQKSLKTSSNAKVYETNVYIYVHICHVAVKSYFHLNETLTQYRFYFLPTPTHTNAASAPGHYRNENFYNINSTLFLFIYSDDIHSVPTPLCVIFTLKSTTASPTTTASIYRKFIRKKKK